MSVPEMHREMRQTDLVTLPCIVVCLRASERSVQAVCCSLGWTRSPASSVIQEFSGARSAWVGWAEQQLGWGEAGGATGRVGYLLAKQSCTVRGIREQWVGVKKETGL